MMGELGWMLRLPWVALAHELGGVSRAYLSEQG